MEDMLLDHTEEFAQLHEKYITYHLELCNQRYMLLHHCVRLPISFDEREDRLSTSFPPTMTALATSAVKLCTLLLMSSNIIAYGWTWVRQGTISN